MVVDMVFSLDSIITAVGMVDELAVMIAAVVVSVALMMAFAGAIGRFVNEHPTIKMLALAFLVVVGVVLIADGFEPARAQGLHLLRDGVLDRRRDAQHHHARSRQAGGGAAGGAAYTEESAPR